MVFIALNLNVVLNNAKKNNGFLFKRKRKDNLQPFVVIIMFVFKLDRKRFTIRRL